MNIFTASVTITKKVEFTYPMIQNSKNVTFSQAWWHGSWTMHCTYLGEFDLSKFLLIARQLRNIHA